MLDLPDTMADLPDTMVDLPDTSVDIPDTTEDRHDTMVFFCLIKFYFSTFVSPRYFNNKKSTKTGIIFFIPRCMGFATYSYISFAAFGI